MSLLAFAAATRTVSPRLAGLCGILLMFGLSIGLAYRYRRAETREGSLDNNPPLTGDSARIDRATKTLRITVAVMPILLLSGLWVTRGQPLLPRLVGAAINLLITAYFVFLLRRTKKSQSRLVSRITCNLGTGPHFSDYRVYQKLGTNLGRFLNPSLNCQPDSALG
jgi:hypothetical protein